MTTPNQQEARKIVARWKREIKKVLSHFIISNNVGGLRCLECGHGTELERSSDGSCNELSETGNDQKCGCICEFPDSGPCWCRSWSEGEHGEACLAAKALWDKTQPATKQEGDQA